MRLQKQLNKRTKKKEYYRHVVILPEDQVRVLGWKAKESLESSVVGCSITIKKKEVDVK